MNDVLEDYGVLLYRSARLFVKYMLYDYGDAMIQRDFIDTRLYHRTKEGIWLIRCT